jgi:beta-xylosidase
VYCSDLADPYVLRVDDSYAAYSTQTEDFQIPVLTSGGLLSARGDRSEALARLPAWATWGRVWAPAVLARPGGFVLYYTTTAQNPDRQCISRAVSAEPTEFVDDSTDPLVCPAHGGAIDPSPVVAPDGRAYLLWKNYGGTDGIVARELSADGLSFVGPTQVLVDADQAWEGGLVEGPTMAPAPDGHYYLFYSANDWTTANYAVGYAVCDSPLGPCTKAPGPWLASTDKAQGPGGQEVFTDEDGQFWLVLHAWVGGKVGYPGGARNLFVLQLDFVNGVPVAT